MKNKTLVHASSVPDVSSVTKGFWVSQKTRAQRTVIPAPSTNRSLTIGVNKGTPTPNVHAQDSIPPT